MTAPERRLHIDRLELDLRGIAPATAEAAARALGPLLAQALAAHPPTATASVDRLDAGRLACPTAPAAQDLAARIAQHVARSLGPRSRP